MHSRKIMELLSQIPWIFLREINICIYNVALLFTHLRGAMVITTRAWSTYGSYAEKKTEQSTIRRLRIGSTFVASFACCGTCVALVIAIADENEELGKYECWRDRKRHHQFSSENVERLISRPGTKTYDNFARDFQSVIRWVFTIQLLFFVLIIRRWLNEYINKNKDKCDRRWKLIEE